MSSRSSGFMRNFEFGGPQSGGSPGLGIWEECYLKGRDMVPREVAQSLVTLEWYIYSMRSSPVRLQ